ncbi:M23 family metallopeptidase [Cryobacterium sp. Sr3]|uniref:M23 family metallopeptidase n=1 Tax=Cryobacterium sp. Sr3 TaxID=1259194 RepID=UPI001F547E4E|nr:M23 family metallopeptidase [Cryobacterium sp. Sr3]
MNAFRLLIAAALLPLSCLSMVRSDAAGVTLPGAASVTETAAETAAETATSGTWHWPLAPPHPLLRGFLAPATQYAPGHRGLDLSAEAGREVVAPAEGIVSFAGVVVDRPVLSIEHADGLVSSIEPVSASVAVGDRVAAGQPVGQVADGGHCAGQCLHLGARLNGGYVSPLLYLVGVPRAVLLPALLLRGDS